MRMKEGKGEIESGLEHEAEQWQVKINETKTLREAQDAG